MHDLVIRNGTIVDGTGAPRRVADIAVNGDLITAVGNPPRSISWKAWRTSPAMSWPRAWRSTGSAQTGQSDAGSVGSAPQDSSSSMGL
jgi:hypothetical protein